MQCVELQTGRRAPYHSFQDGLAFDRSAGRELLWLSNNTAVA
jgi:hypothetical protein